MDEPPRIDDPPDQGKITRADLRQSDANARVPGRRLDFLWEAYQAASDVRYLQEGATILAGILAEQEPAVGPTRETQAAESPFTGSASCQGITHQSLRIPVGPPPAGCENEAESFPVTIRYARPEVEGLRSTLRAV